VHPGDRNRHTTPEEASVTTEIVRDAQRTYADDTIESERGLLVAVLVMVILGVAGIFAVS
jgi:hypothetical protein